MSVESALELWMLQVAHEVSGGRGLAAGVSSDEWNVACSVLGFAELVGFGPASELATQCRCSASRILHGHRH